MMLRSFGKSISRRVSSSSPTHLFEIPAPASTQADTERVAQVLARSFDSLPVSHFLNISSHSGASEHSIHEHYTDVVTKYRDRGALVLQSHNHAAVAIWLPPTFVKKAPTRDEIETMSPQLVELMTLFATAARRHGFDTREHWHLQYIGKDPLRKDDVQAKGAVSVLVKPILKMAKRDGYCVVLESVGDRATDIYKHWGFKTLEVLEADGGKVMFEYMVYNSG